jgi:two-component system sensor histidine kinase KdpD
VSTFVRNVRAHISGVGRRGTAAALGVSIVAVAAVTGLVFLLEGQAPVLSLGALYVLAVLPVAVLFGRGWAIGVSVVSMVIFNFVFIPPTLTFTLHGSENWLAFGVYVVTGLLVADLAARARRRARIAEDREREAALLAELSTTLLSGASVESELPRIAEASARLLGAGAARIELGSAAVAPGRGVALPLRAGDQLIGTLVLASGTGVDPSASGRFLPALASVIGIALDRERLAHEALETEALRRSDLLKTALLRAVSHDLRSPLTAIRASLEALASVELQLDERRRDALLQTALLESERLDRMVRNLLDLSRLQAGVARPALRLRPVDGLLDAALRQFPLDESRIDVSCTGGPLVNVDPAQLERVLVNLLENALKFSPAGERIEVDVTQRGSEVLLRVTDRGPGLPASERERVFEPFQRGAAARAGSGAGLGLAIARGFVEANGGRLWAEASGEGASFVVALPTSADPVRAAV